MEKFLVLVGAMNWDYSYSSDSSGVCRTHGEHVGRCSVYCKDCGYVKVLFSNRCVSCEGRMAGC